MMQAAHSISVYLLGTFDIRCNNPDTTIELRRKTSAVLAFLASTKGPHSRQKLIDMFCQDADDPSGAFRSILSRLRRRVGAEAVLTGGNFVRLNQEVCWVDCQEFEGVMQGNLDYLPLDTLTTTIDLYQGDFLGNIHLSSSPEFEFWVLNERTRYQVLYQHGLEALISLLIRRGEISAAIPRAQQLVRSDPLMEEAHARLIWLYARNGQHEAALEQYEQVSQYLQRELAVEPGPELRTLRDEILAGQIRPSQPGRVSVSELPAIERKWCDFVGRAAEMDQLQQAWQAARPGRTMVVLLDAEAGMGKTRLVHEFAASNPEADFLIGECYESTRTLSYSPWLELLETKLKRLDSAALKQLPDFAGDYLTRLIPALNRRLKRSRPPLAPASGDELNRLFSAVYEFLMELPGTPPSLLFIDNLQWADDASLQLFHFLARRSPPGKVLLIGAMRPEEANDVPALQALVSDLRRHPFLNLQLSPLAPQAIDELIPQLWPGLPEGYRLQVRNMLAKATGGNPLFVSEILRDLARTSHAPSTLPVPKSVRELVQRRLNMLPESTLQVVEAMAILDSPVSPIQAQQVSGRSQEETLMAIDLALRWGLFQPQTEEEQIRYGFDHDLMREAVISQISYARRSLLHHRAAITLERSGAPAATLAHHWQMSGNPEKEAHYAMLAGEQAASMYANDEAVRYLERALRLIQEPGNRLRVIARLGEVLQLLGRHEGAESIYRQGLAAAESAADLLAQADFQVALGALMRLKGEYVQALNWLEKAKAAYQKLGDLKGQAQALWGMGAIFWSQIDHARALNAFEQQLEIARNLGDRRGIGAAMGSMGVVYTELGDFMQALRCLTERIQIALELGDRLSIAKTIGNMGVLYAEQGEYANALACYLSLLRVTLELGDRRNVCVALGNMINIFTEQGEYRLAERISREALSLGRALNIPLYLCDYLNISAELFSRQGYYLEASRLNDEALRIAVQIDQGDVQFSGSLLSIRLKVAMGTASTASAVQKLESMLSVWQKDHQQAAILYEMWRNDKGQPFYQRRSAELYAGLIARSPKIIYRQHYENLTGETLPLPPPLPPPPELILSQPLDLEALLDRVDDLVAGLEEIKNI